MAPSSAVCCPDCNGKSFIATSAHGEVVAAAGLNSSKVSVWFMTMVANSGL